MQTAEVQGGDDEVQEVSGAFVDPPQDVALLGGQRAKGPFAQEIIVPDDDVQRGAQLVGHGPHDVFLEAVGLLQFLKELGVRQRERGELRDAPRDALLVRAKFLASTGAGGLDADDLFAPPQG